MAAGGMGAELLTDTAIFLGSAVIAVPLFKRLGLGSVLGYLTAGAIIGPFGAGVIGDAESVLHFAEFGVVLLLFVIGLELRPSRLWALRKDILGLGMSQVMLTGAILASVGVWFGLSVPAAIAAGYALALSSTAFALQLLQDSGNLNTPYGNRAFSVLLFQDIAIVPMLAVTPLLALWAGPSGGDTNPADLISGKQVALAAAVIVGMILAGRYLLNPIFRIIAQARVHEIGVAAALLIVIGASILMQSIGMSMALGAFLSGVMLAESEYRHQLEADIEPFRGLLLGLFFIAVGMSVDWLLVADKWAMILLAVVALVIVKAAVLLVLSRLFGSPKRDAERIAMTLSQGGEFGFVLFGVAASYALLTRQEASLLSAIVTLSMASTPLIEMVYLAWDKRRDKDSPDMDEHDVSNVDAARALVIGFGRVGQVVTRILKSRDISVTALDFDPYRIQMAKRFGSHVYYGDATRMDVLAAAGAGQADVIFVTIDNKEKATKAIQQIKQSFPNAVLMARAVDRTHAMELTDSEVDFFIRDTFESSILMASEGLKRLDVEDDLVEDTISEFRRIDQETLEKQKADGSYSAVIEGKD